MKPRLAAMLGPLEGRMLNLIGDEIWIGRDSANQICLIDQSVSRQHCVITHGNGQYKLRDDNSSNGTIVNSVPVGEAVLNEGDRIRIGNSMFLFLLSEPDSMLPEADKLSDNGMVANQTLVLELRESLYLHPEKLIAEMTAISESGEKLTPTSLSARSARDLSVLLRISTVINRIHSFAEMQQRILELIFEAVPADRGAILLLDGPVRNGEPDNVGSVFCLSRDDGSRESFHVGFTVINRVWEEGVGLLSNDVCEDPKLQAANSLRIHSVKSLIAAPLVIQEKVIGVLYLDSQQEQFFDERRLEFLTAVANIASAAFENARLFDQLRSDAQRLQATLDSQYKLVGESPAMRTVYQKISKVAASSSTVLLGGESGTGKELAAREIHRRSPRTKRLFVSINCAALTETLFESELFGHERGAFTGAVAQKKGAFELADGGTLFLDEIGEMPIHLQPKLLRAIQEQEFMRVGGTRPIKVDARIIAATNRHIEKMVKEGSFREDLYYRLKVAPIQLPSLRDRREDIPLLAHFFTLKHAEKCGRQVRGLSREARAVMISYDWPGNVRELEHAIEHAITFGSEDLILPEDLPETLHESGSLESLPQTGYHTSLKEAKKKIVLNALSQSDGNYTHAAKSLGLHPNNLHRLIKNLGMKVPILGS